MMNFDDWKDPYNEMYPYNLIKDIIEDSGIYDVIRRYDIIKDINAHLFHEELMANTQFTNFDKTVVYKKYRYNLSYSAIAAELNCTEEKCIKSVKKVLDKLITRYDRKGCSSILIFQNSQMEFFREQLYYIEKYVNSLRKPKFTEEEFMDLIANNLKICIHYAGFDTHAFTTLYRGLARKFNNDYGRTYTLEDVTNCTEYELSKFSGIGPVTIHEIKNVLRQYFLSLKNEPESDTLPLIST